jgi:hypothetical protein
VEENMVIISGRGIILLKDRFVGDSNAEFGVGQVTHNEFSIILSLLVEEKWLFCSNTF